MRNGENILKLLEGIEDDEIEVHKNKTWIDLPYNVRKRKKWRKERRIESWRDK